MTSLITPTVLNELTRQHKTPFYLYSKKILAQTIEELRNVFPVPGFQLLFATMANDNIRFLKTINGYNVGACVNSVKHLSLVRSCGFPANKIQFTSTGLTSAHMKTLLRTGVAVNLDSLSQLTQWFKLQPGANAGIRINTASLTKHIPVSDRLGIEASELTKALQVAEQEKGNINGLHIYVGTNYKSHHEMLPPLVEFFKLATTVPSLQYINIGGGIGVNYMNDMPDFNLAAFGSAVTGLFNNLQQNFTHPLRLIFEPGRRLAAPSGAFVTKVTDVKTLNNQKYVVVDASVAVFPRPLHQPESPHKAYALHNNDQVTEDTLVVGRTTFSRDIMSRTPLPKTLKVGDYIIFDQAGAYCNSMRSRFLGQAEPANILVDG